MANLPMPFADWICRRRLAMPVALFLSLAMIGVAVAHVGIEPAVVAPASNATFTVQVPNEKDVPTTAIRVEFPHGLVVSRFQPKPGWERTEERDPAGLITAVMWSGGQIGAGEYDLFSFIARTPKEAGQLIFKAYQTYEDGEVVEWVNVGGDDRPAPLVEVRADASAVTGESTLSIENSDETTNPAASAAGESMASTQPTAASLVAAAPGEAAVNAPLETASTGGGSDLPLFVALGALVVALVALALAGVSMARRRPVA